MTINIETLRFEIQLNKLDNSQMVLSSLVVGELLDRLEAAEKAVTEAYRRGYATGQEEIAAELEFAKREVANLHDDIHEWMDKCDTLRAKVTEMERQEPVEWQCRSRPSWGDHQWSNWKSCNPGYAQDITKSPTLHDWQHEARPLYALPGAQPAPSVPECPYPCGWRNLLKHAIEDGAYLARSINEDEPVTENARSVTMRMVMRLRDVLMAINNAAPEVKP